MGMLHAVGGFALLVALMSLMWVVMARVRKLRDQELCEYQERDELVRALGPYRTEVVVGHALPPETEEIKLPKFFEELPKRRTVVPVGDERFMHWDHVVEAWELRDSYKRATLARTRLGALVLLEYTNYNETWAGEVVDDAKAAQLLLSAGHDLPESLHAAALKHLV